MKLQPSTYNWKEMVYLFRIKLRLSQSHILISLFYLYGIIYEKSQNQINSSKNLILHVLNYA
jgi:hypothetical protein